ncbi:MAG: twin-arginine translocation signal domain-containing protein [Candidatus Electrothrix sp. ATG2]|nr:twin-arginine translocation signal domain-containing protein [Candidatus Electrothrix sp. ATG2]
MEEKMQDKRELNAPDSENRRKALKTLAIGAGALAGSTVLPERWVSPVIESIALPAHAQTSASTSVFCTPAELTLAEGHSGTDEMIIEASGCITPPQANIELELTLNGYDVAVITDNKATDGTDDNKFLAVVSEALVPSAHAAAAPRCSVTVKTRTDANGNFFVRFIVKCGPGIVQAVLQGTLFGQFSDFLGVLDIPSCNPCGSGSTASATPAPTTPMPTTSWGMV